MSHNCAHSFLSIGYLILGENELAGTLLNVGAGVTLGAGKFLNVLGRGGEYGALYVFGGGIYDGV